MPGSDLMTTNFARARSALERRGSAARFLILEAAAMGSSGEAGLGREDVFHPFDKLQILQEAFGDLKAGSVPAVP